MQKKGIERAIFCLDESDWIVTTGRAVIHEWSNRQPVIGSNAAWTAIRYLPKRLQGPPQSKAPVQQPPQRKSLSECASIRLL